jgi:hypothetical protein
MIGRAWLGEVVKIGRRGLIAGLIGIGVGAAWRGGRAQRAAVPPAAATDLHGALAAFCRGLRCPERLRGACLRALPADEAQPERLAALVLAGLAADAAAEGAAGGAAAAIAPAALPRLIRQASRRDFAKGRISYVDGWMLSATETRVYALAALLKA